ncbi:hypothetical protein Cp4435_02457 [Clostridium perfringens]|jgi:hypothetical protein|nr:MULTISPECIES: hypothetical protein [Clostridiaceae]MDG6885256.1 hypothetical protein [Clostridium perfringens]MDH5096466.1 hypothetical protein [Clostridium perfringens]
MKKSYLVIILALIITLIGVIGFNKNKFSSKFDQLLEVSKGKDSENELSGGFPYNIEFLDYNITINSVRLFEDYALFDYSVKKIDGGYINITDVNITGNVNFKGREFYISPNDVERRWEYSSVRIISTGEIIAKENKDSPANLSFSINARSADGSYIAKSVSIKEEVYLTDEDYLSLNKKITFDNVDFEIRSFANFEFGSLLYIFVGNKDEEECKRIANQYVIKLISGDYERSFDLEKWVGFTDLAIRKYSSIDSRYDKNSQHDQFYMSRMFYNLNEVDRENIEVYLVNKKTNDEVKII